jgi:hypothetical protein
MIGKAHLNNMRNAEHMQYMVSAHDIFTRHDMDAENLGECYEEMTRCGMAEENALAGEKNFEKIHEKNAADKYRDKLYSRFLNYVKSITYDDRDPHVQNAKAVFKILKEIGNPTRLAENAESAMITTIGNRLEPVSTDVEAIGAADLLAALLKANQEFVDLERECRDIATSHSDLLSVAAARKKSDAIYRVIVNAINGYAAIPSKATNYKSLIADMNTLINKYNALVAGRGNNDEGNSDDSEGNAE